MRLRNLLDLASADLENAHEELSQIYKWKFEHQITAAKASVAAGASLAVAITVALFQAKVTVTHALVAAGYAGAGVVIVLGIIQYYRVRVLYQQFISAHFLLSEVTKLKPFLQRYGSEVKGD